MLWKDDVYSSKLQVYYCIYMLPTLLSLYVQRNDEPLYCILQPVRGNAFLLYAFFSFIIIVR